MQKDVGLVLGAERFGVTCLAVGDIDLPRFGVVDDMCPQDGDLRKACFRGLDQPGQLVAAGGGRCRFFERAA